MSVELIVFMAAGVGVIVGRIWQWVKDAKTAMNMRRPTDRRKQ